MRWHERYGWSTVDRLRWIGGLRPHCLVDRAAQDAATPMAGNGELGGVALWSASACAGYTGVESATRRTRLGHSEDVRRRR